MDDPALLALAEAIDRVRHRGLKPIRKKVCSHCTEEAILVIEELKKKGYQVEARTSN
jgi:hypothetical protein